MFIAMVYFRKRRQIKIKGGEAAGRVWEGWVARNRNLFLTDAEAGSH